jgi:hypothetical protein
MLAPPFSNRPEDSNMTITQRKLAMRTGWEGPSHDPYSWLECTLTLNGVAITLHMGLATWIKIDGKRIDDHTPDSSLAPLLFERHTGLTVYTFNEAYNRIHPYFDDPMGKLSDYE